MNQSSLLQNRVRLFSIKTHIHVNQSFLFCRSEAIKTPSNAERTVHSEGLCHVAARTLARTRAPAETKQPERLASSLSAVYRPEPRPRDPIPHQARPGATPSSQTTAAAEATTACPFYRLSSFRRASAWASCRTHVCLLLPSSPGGSSSSEPSSS